MEYSEINGGGLREGAAVLVRISVFSNGCARKSLLHSCYMTHEHVLNSARRADGFKTISDTKIFDRQ